MLKFVRKRKRNNHCFFNNLIAVVPHLVFASNEHISDAKGRKDEETWAGGVLPSAPNLIIRLRWLEVRVCEGGKSFRSRGAGSHIKPSACFQPLFDAFPLWTQRLWKRGGGLWPTLPGWVRCWSPHVSAPSIFRHFTPLPGTLVLTCSHQPSACFQLLLDTFPI